MVKVLLNYGATNTGSPTQHSDSNLTCNIVVYSIYLYKITDRYPWITCEYLSLLIYLWVLTYPRVFHLRIWVIHGKILVQIWVSVCDAKILMSTGPSHPWVDSCSALAHEDKVDKMEPQHLPPTTASPCSQGGSGANRPVTISMTMTSKKGEGRRQQWRWHQYQWPPAPAPPMQDGTMTGMMMPMAPDPSATSNCL